MKEALDIPKILIYEAFDGHPIYRKGYKDFLTGLKKVEEIMGTSALQSFITSNIIKYLNRTLPDSYFVATGELGLHVIKNTNFAADIAIYREGRFQVGFESTHYSETPPNVVIEIDIKADESDYFQNEDEYFQKKTERLLQWGVERVIWVFSSTRRILIADNLQKWELISWDLPVPIIDEYQMIVWDLMLKNGFRVE